MTIRRDLFPCRKDFGRGIQQKMERFTDIWILLNSILGERSCIWYAGFFLQPVALLEANYAGKAFQWPSEFVYIEIVHFIGPGVGKPQNYKKDQESSFEDA